MRRRHRGAAVLLAVSVLTMAGGGWAAASAPAAPSRTVRLELASAGDTGAPAVTIPAARRLDAASRRSTARALQPGAATASTVRAEARAAGLTVTASSAWELTVSGSAALTEQLFGTDPEALVVPPAWRSDVTAVIDPTAGQGVWHSAAIRPAALATKTQTVAALSESYGAGAPSSAVPAITSSTPIIATVQFSGWDDSDLTTFAPSVYGNAYDPVASGQFTEVGIGRGTGWLSGRNGDGAGYQEVALDQETLLASAPELRQRAYIGQNTSGGLVSVLQQVQSDIESGMPIVALSTSWGECEQYPSADVLSEEDTLLHQLTALGVSVFASSGDSGKNDCAGESSPVGVDFPASDPNVVAVGGTSHPNGAAPPAPDTAWAEAVSGSGGGQSVIFPKPSWQADVAPGSTRAVPDIAADADENTGVAVVVTNPGTGSTSEQTIGGTSLSSPLVTGMAAVMAAKISSSTGEVGLGDIHSILYANAATDAVDVVQVVPTAPSSYSTEAPGVGYDEVTGLGTPRMDVLTALLTPTPAPAATAIFAPAPVLTPPTVQVTSWSRPDVRKRDAVVKWQVSGGTAVLQGFQLTVTQGSKTVLTKSVAAGSRSATLLLNPGTYAVRVIALTPAGTSAASGRNSTTVPSDAATASGWTTWKRVKDGNAYDGTLTTSATSGRTLKYTATGSVFGVLLRDSKDGGEAELVLDGKKVKTISLYRAKTTELVAVSVKANKVGKHTLTIEVLGRHAHGATGNTVAVDAFTYA